MKIPAVIPRSTATRDPVLAARALRSMPGSLASLGMTQEESLGMTLEESLVMTYEASFGMTPGENLP
jgi:hypothetical protein